MIILLALSQINEGTGIQTQTLCQTVFSGSERAGKYGLGVVEEGITREAKLKMATANLGKKSLSATLA